jgi:uncharacterized protein YndB with AHSA1/START domain
MRVTNEDEPASMNRTVVKRRSDRELVVTRTVNGPARLLFEAWTKPELLKRWWAPCSLGVRRSTHSTSGAEPSADWSH